MRLFEHSCREAGLKLTPQRREIYRELARATDHPTAETLHRRLQPRMPNISLDTVYRTLATLEKTGLISRVQTAESQARFEAETARHHHFICDRCRKIIDFRWEFFDLAAVPEELRAFGRVQSKNAVLRGICNDCLGKGRER